MKKSFVCFIVLLFCLNFLSANQQFDSSLFSINIHPQFLFLNGIKSDLEYKFKSNFNVFGGFQYYTGKTNISGEKSKKNTNGSTADQTKRANDQIEGLGFNIGAKYYISDNNNFNKFYLGVEISQTEYTYQLNDYDYFAYVDDGLTFYEYKLGEIEAKSKQVISSFFVGQTLEKGRFLVNGWIGISYINSTSSQNLNTLRNYNEYLWDYNYKGFSPLLGFKIGYSLIK